MFGIWIYQERCVYFFHDWCPRDGCTSFYFQCFWNEWSWSSSSSLGSISLSTLDTSGKRWKQWANGMWLSLMWFFCLLLIMGLYYTVYRFSFVCIRRLITLVMSVKPLKLDPCVIVLKFSNVTFWRIMMCVIWTWVA